jgi:D-lactate dehydrogenase (cytochrome)
MVRQFTEDQVKALSSLVGPDCFSTGESYRELHRKDMSPHEGTLPAGVIWPASTEETARILSWTYEHDIPVSPWGAGSSLEGNPIPTRFGLVMDFTRMDKILALRNDDLQADVQPGVTRKSLNKAAGPHGLFFPPDPGVDATIGGMIGNNASGVRALKYGATKDHVLALTVVLPHGEVMRTGCRANKSSSGYDLTRLFVGAEGTLGVVTEATLLLKGIPPHHLATVVSFDSLEDAARATVLLVGSGMEPAALELLTPNLIRLMNRDKNLGLPETPTLFCEFHGPGAASLQETADIARELCEDCGAKGFHSGIEERERQDLWRARHEAYETVRQAHPGKLTPILDAAVPISRYPELTIFAQKTLDEAGVTGYVFGHAGNGNLHVNLVGDTSDEDEWRRIRDVDHAIVQRAVELGGTCTGEHGVGIGKRRFMAAEHGKGYEFMRRIKELVDPKGLMNPDKIF